MGRGNAIPQGACDYEFLYIDNKIIQDYFIEFEYFERELIYKIKNRWGSFYSTDKWRRSNRSTYKVILENKLVNIELGNNGISTMISVTIEDYDLDYCDFEDKRRINLAYKHLKNYYNGILNILKDMFKKESGIITKRTSAWTSATIY